MKNLKIKLGLFSLLAILAVSVFLTSCEQESIQQPLITDYEKATQILGEYVVEQNGTFVLSENDPYKLGIEPSLFDELVSGLKEMNNLLKQGEIKREWINKTIDIETLEEVAIDVRGCNQNGIYFYWFGATVYMSTNSASWASIVGCGALGFITGAGGIACGVIVQMANQWGCPCGYIATVGYNGYVYAASCQ